MVHIPKEVGHDDNTAELLTVEAELLHWYPLHRYLMLAMEKGMQP